DHSWVNDLIQAHAARFVREHYRPKFLAIDRAVGGKNTFSKVAYDVCVSGTVRLHNRVSYLVGVKRHAAEFGEHRNHVALANCDAACESNLEHRPLLPVFDWFFLAGHQLVERGPPAESRDYLVVQVIGNSCDSRHAAVQLLAV